MNLTKTIYVFIDTCYFLVCKRELCTVEAIAKDFVANHMGRLRSSDTSTIEQHGIGLGLRRRIASIYGIADDYEHPKNPTTWGPNFRFRRNTQFTDPEKAVFAIFERSLEIAVANFHSASGVVNEEDASG